MFWTAFQGTFVAVLQIALVVAGAGALVRGGIVTRDHIRALSVVTVNVFLPCLIVSNISKNFRPGENEIWWAVPLIGLAVALLGLAIALLFFFRELPEKLNILPLAFLQNAAFLILPIGQLLFPARFDEFALFVFLYIIIHQPFVWSVGKVLMTTRKEGEPFRIRQMFTPPMSANLLTVMAVLLGITRFIPDLVMTPVSLIGQAAVPTVTFILGASLGSLEFRKIRLDKDIVRILLVKLILLPAAVVGILSLTPLRETYPLLALIIVLQGASAPATALLLQVKTYGGDEEKVQTVLLLAYVLCLVTIPLWVALWQSLA